MIQAYGETNIGVMITPLDNGDVGFSFQMGHVRASFTLPPEEVMRFMEMIDEQYQAATGSPSLLAPEPLPTASDCPGCSQECFFSLGKSGVPVNNLEGV